VSKGFLLNNGRCGALRGITGKTTPSNCVQIKSRALVGGFHPGPSSEHNKKKSRRYNQRDFISLQRVASLKDATSSNTIPYDGESRHILDVEIIGHNIVRRNK
jgi:hypothetical protein